MVRVLIVDDEKSVRVPLCEFLRDGGYEVEMAEDAMVAQERLQQEAFDVVVSDIVLPRVSGVELLKIIRQGSPRVQVILMTGEPTVDTASAAVRAGAFDYLAKPVTKEAVLRVVGNAARVKALDDERERLAVENRRYQENLEELVRERTRELETSNVQLQGAVEEITKTQDQMVHNERMNALGQMAGGIAHDFNNALMPIMGHSEYFITQPKAMENREELLNAMTDIHTAAEDAREIVRRLREFYRPDEDVQRFPVNINDVVKTVVNLTKTRWQEQTRAQGFPVEIECQLTKVSLVPAAEHELREALTNLILNAVDAMPRGGTIGIRTASEGEQVCLTLTDSGTGMSGEVRRHCFEPFFSTKGEKGTGLGLAMVHGIVHRHDGTIEVSSVEGEGTEFIIRLPVYGKRTGEMPVAPVDPVPGVAALSILAVDDDESSLRSVTRCLERSGHCVVATRRGREALEKIRQQRFDVVITDRAMPEVNGDQVALAVKELAPETRVIMLTGFGEMMELEDERPDGVDLILAKPVMQQQIRAAVDKVMKGQAEGGKGQAEGGKGEGL